MLLCKKKKYISSSVQLNVNKLIGFVESEKERDINTF